MAPGFSHYLLIDAGHLFLGLLNIAGFQNTVVLIIVLEYSSEGGHFMLNMNHPLTDSFVHFAY